MNLSLLAIPAHWLISIAPHAYALRTINSANSKVWNNANPRGAALAASLHKVIPAETLGRFERAEAAHKNGMENLPVFAAAVLSATVAGVDPGVVATHSALFLALRVVYTLLYINVTDRKTSFARTGVWVTSSLVCLALFVRAAFAG